jgi:hypothetical protein
LQHGTLQKDTTMADLFGRNVSKLGGVFTADNAKLNFFGLPIGVLVQQLSVQYAQSITRLYDVASPNQYYVGGRTNGQMSLNRVIGPAGSSVAFYTAYGDVCGSVGRNIKLQLQETNCATAVSSVSEAIAASLPGGGSQPSTYTMDNVVITQVSVGVAAQDMIIGENTGLMYTSLEVE